MGERMGSCVNWLLIHSEFKVNGRMGTWVFSCSWEKRSLVPRLSLLAHTTWREISLGDVTTIRTKSSRVSGRRTPGH